VASLFIAGGMLIPFASRERGTAEFLTVLAGEAWTRDAAHASLEQASAYSAVFWFDLVLAASCVLIAAGLLLHAGHSMYGAAVLIAGLTAASAVWGLLGSQPEVGRELPIGVVAVALMIVAGVAFVGSVAGFGDTAPAETRRPLSPPVPPSHQAG
jgi:drug/metabolite transporter (DMT)-like permease